MHFSTSFASTVSPPLPVHPIFVMTLCKVHFFADKKKALKHTCSKAFIQLFLGYFSKCATRKNLSFPVYLVSPKTILSETVNITYHSFPFLYTSDR